MIFFAKINGDAARGGKSGKWSRSRSDLFSVDKKICGVAIPGGGEIVPDIVLNRHCGNGRILAKQGISVPRSHKEREGGSADIAGVLH